jgi:hypothetical protein
VIENPCYCFLDFEYNGTRNKKLSLVSCSYVLGDENYNLGEVQKVWLHKDDFVIDDLMETFEKFRQDGIIFVAYAVTAEASSFYSADVNPVDFCWIDLYLEYAGILNHSHFMYGKHLIDGKVQITFRPKYGETGKNHKKPEKNLASCCYKMLGEIIDTQEKEEVRDIIIRGDYEEIEQNKERILDYNASDIFYLPRILKAMRNWYHIGANGDSRGNKWYAPKELDKLDDEMLLRGDYAARTAIMEREGYPIDLEKTRAFASSVRSILNEMSRDINSQFPDNPPFIWDRRAGRFSMHQLACRDFIETTPHADNWRMTDGGKKEQPTYSLKLEAWEDFFDYRHTYPRNNFGAQIVRFLKTKQSLNGFMPKVNKKKKDKVFWDSVDDEGFVHPYMNIYGSQSSRSQASATNFIPLKAAWMRALIVPPRGKAIGAIDYKSQEFLLQALISGDRKMVEAYHSGDVYVHFGKSCGMIPKDGTKETHPNERQICKSTLLGIGYSMTSTGLSIKLTQDTGKDTSKTEAQKFIDLFNRTYPVYSKWKKQFWATYQKNKFYKLPCGWPIFGQNDNERSVTNVPVQGLAASIMRKAVSLAQDRGLQVIFTLHDALYIMYDLYDYKKISTLAECMLEAVIHYFPNNEDAKLMGLDAETWSPEYKSISGTSIPCGKLKKIKVEEIHIDERAVDDYERFKKYFSNDDELLAG